MTLPAFCSTVIALLVSPGPTNNTLICLAGSRQGLRNAAKLIPAELLGYLTTTLPLVFIGVSIKFGLLGLAIVGAALVWVTAGALTRTKTGNLRYFHVIQRLASA